jgi:chromosome segregation ATPase
VAADASSRSGAGLKPTAELAEAKSITEAQIESLRNRVSQLEEVERFANGDFKLAVAQELLQLREELETARRTKRDGKPLAQRRRELEKGISDLESKAKTNQQHLECAQAQVVKYTEFLQSQSSKLQTLRQELRTVIEAEAVSLEAGTSTGATEILRLETLLVATQKQLAAAKCQDCPPSSALAVADTRAWKSPDEELQRASASNQSVGQLVILPVPKGHDPTSMARPTAANVVLGIEQEPHFEECQAVDSRANREATASPY